MLVSLNEKSLIVPDMPIWRLTVDQYHEMIRAGILTADDRIELLEGLLVTKMTKNPPHSLATQIIRDVLTSLVTGNYFVSDQEPMTTSDSEPEPDVMIVQGKRRDFTEKHPSPNDVLLVVEVADLTLQRDKTVKLSIYAQANIPVYWILNLPERQLEVYQQSQTTSYQEIQVYQENDSFDFWFAGKNLGRIAVASLLP